MLRAIAMGDSGKWWVFFTIAISTFLTVVDNGSVLVALPSIEGHFDADLSTVQWVIVGHGLAISVLLLPMGRLGDMAGRKRVYIAGFGVFLLASALAGVSPGLSFLIGAKAFQGVGAAMLLANGVATLTSVFPGSERGKVLGSHLSVVGTGAIAGPVMGGLLVSAFGWRWIFFINIPIGLVGIAVAALVLTGGRQAQAGETAPRQAFDWLGAALSGGTLLAFLLVVGNGSQAGWTSAAVLAGGIASVSLLAAFIWWELRTASPMLELRLFRRKLVALGVTASWLSYLGIRAARFMMPFYLQRVLGYGPTEVGLMLVPAALCTVFVAPVAGRLSDRFGWRKFTVSGMALASAASFVLAANLTERSPALLVVLMLMVFTTSAGLFNSPNNNSIFSAVERSRYGVVSALTQLVRNTGNVASIAIATAIVVATMGSMGVQPSLDSVSPEVAGAFVAGLHRAFLLMGILLVAGAVICLVKGEGPGEPAEEPRRTRPAESASGEPATR